MTSTGNKTDAVCDMCRKPDGHDGFHLLTCRDCGLQVHQECYGYVKNDNNKKKSSVVFSCWACAAVGSTVKCRDRHAEDRKRKTIRITERPTECCFCSVDDGLERPHAMHPLFDDHGPEARQIVLPPNPRHVSKHTIGRNRKNHPAPNKHRPAFAHTVCAMALTLSKGFAFGCYRSGDTGESDNSDNERFFSDDGSINSELDVEEDDLPQLDYDLDETTHHFVFNLEKYYGKKHASVKERKEYQKSLKCFVCGFKDTHCETLRVPLQCNANDAEEMEAGKGTHKSHDPCCQALHVGCGHYGPSQIRRFYYNPGTTQDPVSCLYCNAHASDVVRAQNKSQEQSPPRPPPPNPRPRGVASSAAEHRGQAPPQYRRVSKVTEKHHAQKNSKRAQQQQPQRSRAASNTAHPHATKKRAWGSESENSRYHLGASGVGRSPTMAEAARQAAREVSLHDDGDGQRARPSKVARKITAGTAIGGSSEATVVSEASSAKSYASMAAAVKKPTSLARVSSESSSSKAYASMAKSSLPSKKPNNLSRKVSSNLSGGGNNAHKSKNNNMNRPRGTLELGERDRRRFEDMVQDLKKLKNLVSGDAAAKRKVWKREAFLHLSSGAFNKLWEEAIARSHTPPSRAQQLPHSHQRKAQSGDSAPDEESAKNLSTAQRMAEPLRQRARLSESKTSERVAKTEKLYRLVVERIGNILFSEEATHRPLDTILNEQKETWSKHPIARSLTTRSFGELWQRVSKRAESEWFARIHTRDAVWGFLVVGEDYDNGKCEEFLSNIDSCDV